MFKFSQSKFMRRKMIEENYGGIWNGWSYDDKWWNDEDVVKHISKNVERMSRKEKEDFFLLSGINWGHD